MKLKNGLMLFLATVFWGTTFVAQSVGMDYVEPFTFLAARSFIGSAFLGLCLLGLYFIRKIKPQRMQEKSSEEKKLEQKNLILGGLACGVALTIASALQQIGIQYTTVGKAGFLTALYIIFVPIVGIFLKKAAGIKIWISVALAAIGLYLLCMTERFALTKGDTYVLLCALAFTVHILIIDHFSPKVDGVKLSCVQFLVVGVLSSICMWLFETPTVGAIGGAMGSILYAGIFSSGIAYTLQILGQKDMSPTIASLIMSLESVVSVVSGFLILQQALSIREVWGCVFMFGAIILAQLPNRFEKTLHHQEDTASLDMENVG